MGQFTAVKQLTKYGWQINILVDKQLAGTEDDVSNRFGVKLNGNLMDICGGYNDRYLNGRVSIKLEKIVLNYAKLIQIKY